jgi:hypothetical protein
MPYQFRALEFRAKNVYVVNIKHGKNLANLTGELFCYVKKGVLTQASNVSEKKGQNGRLLSVLRRYSENVKSSKKGAVVFCPKPLLTVTHRYSMIGA